MIENVGNPKAEFYLWWKKVVSALIFFGWILIWKPWDDLCYIFILEVDLPDVQEEGEGTYYQKTDWAFQTPLFVDGWMHWSGGKLESAALLRMCNEPGKEGGFQEEVEAFHGKPDLLTQEAMVPEMQD